MRKSAVWLGASVALVGLPAMAQEVPPGWRYGPGMMWGGGWAWMMLLGPLMMVVFVAAVILLAVVALRARRDRQGRVRGAPTRPRRVIGHRRRGSSAGRGRPLAAGFVPATGKGRISAPYARLPLGFPPFPQPGSGMSASFAGKRSSTTAKVEP
jgi:uncharacterized membrane protein